MSLNELKAPQTQMFVQQIILANNKETPKHRIASL